MDEGVSTGLFSVIHQFLTHNIQIAPVVSLHSQFVSCETLGQQRLQCSLGSTAHSIDSKYVTDDEATWRIHSPQVLHFML